jgi:surface polysaccharide O-acyltransferase-like enzyme
MCITGRLVMMFSVEENASTEKKRYDFLDILKTIGIYFVVMYHYNNLTADILVNNNFVNYFHYFIKSIFSTCVPIFFFVNGFLLLNKPLDLKRHTYKIIRILIISVIWQFITVFALMIIRKEYFSIIEIIKIVATLRVGWGNHIWYLRALIIIYTILPVIKVSYDTNKTIFNYFLYLVMILTFGNVLIAISANIFEYIIGKNYINGHFDFFTSINIFHGIHGYSVGYFLLGGICMNYREEVGKRFSKTTVLCIIFCSMLFLTIYGIIMSRSNGELFDVVFTGYATIFTLINVLAISYLTSNYKSVGIIGKLIALIGENTLGIYFLHVFVGTIVIQMYKTIEISTNILTNIVFALVVLLFSLLVTILLKKIPIIRELFRIG